MAVVLPIVAATTMLTVHLSRGALEDATRQDGLVLARELAATAGRQRTEDTTLLAQEIHDVLGRGSAVQDAVVYRPGPGGLILAASGGTRRPAALEDEIVAREGQEIATLVTDPGRAWRVHVPIWDGRHPVGDVALTLPLGAADVLARRIERQAVILSLAAVVLLVGALSLFLSRGVVIPLTQILSVMSGAEEGDLSRRAPTARTDEVGRVARGLNHMLDRVSSFRTELTHRVAEATAELRAANERLYAAQRRMAQHERLAAAGELAAAMAHGVGTPLTAVSGHLQLLEEAIGDPAIQARLRTIQEQVDQAVATAHHFLDAARPARVRIPVDVTGLLHDLLLLASPESQRKRISVQTVIPEALPKVSGDPHQLQELFHNLIVNALEAMGAGGTLTLDVAPCALPSGVPAVRITVADTGSGISAEVLPHVFTPFFTTRAGAGGTGLGLAIAQRIATAHGGTLRLDSTPGSGTRAIVELPAG
ncbi:MAG TPA: ATP-binding protein [Candidatus Baltobacteraceae bacterium]|nr:ATP-binding protein [Candidatus Baltobacteraceae bacterium]